jgi:hypothetical protein
MTNPVTLTSFGGDRIRGSLLRIRNSEQAFSQRSHKLIDARQRNYTAPGVSYAIIQLPPLHLSCFPLCTHRTRQRTQSSSRAQSPFLAMKLLDWNPIILACNQP